MRMAGAIAYDIKLQHRHGFYYAYLVISLFYIMLLRLLPASSREMADVLLTFTDPSMLGFFFIGGLVLLEKGHDIHNTLFVTPYKPEEYMMSKTLSLTLLSMISSYLIHVSQFGFSTNPLLFMTGVFLTSVFFTLAGMGVAFRCRSLNGFFFLSTLVTFVFMLPIMDFLHIWSTPIYYILPTQGSFLLLRSAFEPVPWLQILYAVLLLAGWIGLAFLWVRYSFRKFIMLRLGGDGS
ncbi:ABC transporter permease [Paenibacillus lutimineralis]|uniref:ABC transporter permease n=1 Tax=Paenibacillus lutimineralis TaxID=2707005 RepID=A0A3S9UZL9_9BACL|nr:ABC transporter permease [Paenibacillus lutimineralis]AZS15794.1 ABC transporter permease [Paenibacillus lutimineralis]